VAFLSFCPLSRSQDTTEELGTDKNPLGFRFGSIDLHPRLTSGATYDNNIDFTTTNAEKDVEWTIQPAIQIVGGDEQGLVKYRIVKDNVLNLSPGDVIINEVEDWPGNVFILDYGPRFQMFQKYSNYNSIDQLGYFNVLFPLNKTIFGFKQDYEQETTTIIEAGQRAKSQVISTTISGAYRFGDRTSFESNLQRYNIDYDSPNLTGYTEYGTENWLNYNFQENLHGSLGVLAGVDEVDDYQNQVFEQIRARLRYSYTEKLFFDVSAGGELRQYENGHSDTLDPVFNMTGKYFATKRTTLAVVASRQQIASIYNGYYYADTGAAISLRQEIVRYCAVNLSTGYHDLNYTPTDNHVGPQYSDSYYDARISVEFNIATHFSGQIYYRVLNLASELYGNVDDQQVGARLTYRF
jgi:hypothetical protein